MKLSFSTRLKLCFEVLTCAGGQEKALPLFQRGYDAGLKDGNLECLGTAAGVRVACARRAEEVVWSLSLKEARENIKRAVLNA